MTHTGKIANLFEFNWILKICPKFSHFSSNCSSSNQLGAHGIDRVLYSSSRNKLLSVKELHLKGLSNFSSGRSPEDRPIPIARHANFAKAQAALCDYLQITRGMYMTEAEHISKNCPLFICRILKKVENAKDIERALVRYFNYHPINEFEPFFESLGLKPSEYNSLLPQELMFLSDADELLNNYRVLSSYGIACGEMGKMYAEAKGIFEYGSDLLKSKLLAYEQLGLSKDTVIKLCSSTPNLLLGAMNEELCMLLKKLEEIGLPKDWIGGAMLDKNTCYWGKMLLLLDLFKDMGFEEKKLGTLISKHPGLLLDGSGKAVFVVSCLLLKMGVSRREIFIMFLEFPCVQAGSFVQNLRGAFEFLVEIEMDSEDIKSLIRLHKHALGCISLKKPSSVLHYLNTSKKKLCEIITEDPRRMQKFARGLKVLPLPASDSVQQSMLEKKKFLSRMGYIEESKEMNSALRVFRGKGDELQGRFDFLVKSGLNPEDVLEMLKKTPQILNLKIELMNEKLSFIVNALGYPLSSVAKFPQCLLYTTERVKRRHLMYDWLKQRGKAMQGLALSSLLACSDKKFMKKYVHPHPEGAKAWEDFKNAPPTDDLSVRSILSRSGRREVGRVQVKVSD